MDTLPTGQSSKSPAFSFYAKEWLAATLSWALDARGAYATLMAYQWDAGSVPGDDMAALGRVLGVSSTKTRLIWSVISSKFERGADGHWRNLRLEQERERQKARREALKANGAKGGRPRENQTQTNRLSLAKPSENQNESLAFSSSSSSDSNESQKSERAPIQGSGAYAPGSLPRDHMHHVLCGSKMKICLKAWEYSTLAKAYNHPDADMTRGVLEQFVGKLEDGLTDDAAIGPFSWIEKQFHAYLKSIGRVAPKLEVTPKHRGVAELLAEEQARKAARLS